MSRRSGYTLLEVVLAIGIGLLLLAALYVALDLQLRYMSSGRRAVAEAQLARGLLNRIAADVRASLAMLPTTPTAEAATAAATSSSSTGSSAAAAGSSDTQTASTGQFAYGLVGDSQQITLFISSVPRLGQTMMETPLGVCDQRRIVYALVPGQGLVRQEIRNVAGDEFNDNTATADVLAAEVVELQFRYFNATTGVWDDQWDGSISGPPLAVEITLGLTTPSEYEAAAAGALATYRLVVSVPTATVPNPLKGGAP